MYYLINARPVGALPREMGSRKQSTDVRDHQSSSTTTGTSTAATTTHQQTVNIRTTTKRSNESEIDEGTLQPQMPRVVHMCQCCFEDLAEISARCSQGHHLFCQSCVRHYVEAFVSGELYPLLDVPDSDGTSLKALPCLSSDCVHGHIPFFAVQNACTSRVSEQYQEKIFHLMADDSFSSSSSFSGWDSDSTENNANEQNIDSSSSARDDLIGRAVEEAMTESQVRRCPRCAAAFVKESGCNKMRCPFCRVNGRKCTAICYVCRQRVSNDGYEHFCPHSADRCLLQCGKCPLWTTQDERTDRQRLIDVWNEANRLWELSLLEQRDEHYHLHSSFREGITVEI